MPTMLLHPQTRRTGQLDTRATRTGTRAASDTSVNNYSLEHARERRPYTIRGLKPAKDPHKACPTCYADCVSLDAGQLLEYRCERGHQFTGFLSDGLNHALWVARYNALTEPSR